MTSRQHSIAGGQSGQIVIEYVLLLIIAVTVATIMTTTIASRDPNATGFLIKKWVDIIQAVGKDTSDDLMPTEQ